MAKTSIFLHVLLQFTLVVATEFIPFVYLNVTEMNGEGRIDACCNGDVGRLKFRSGILGAADVDNQITNLSSEIKMFVDISDEAIYFIDKSKYPPLIGYTRSLRPYDNCYNSTASDAFKVAPGLVICFGDALLNQSVQQDLVRIDTAEDWTRGISTFTITTTGSATTIVNEETTETATLATTTVNPTSANRIVIKEAVLSAAGKNKFATRYCESSACANTPANKCCAFCKSKPIEGKNPCPHYPLYPLGSGDSSY